MARYYKKNAYLPVGVAVALGAQSAEPEISSETKEMPQISNCQGRKQKGRKCGKCGIMLKDKRQYIIDWINQGLQPLCLECYKK